jgi:sugar lactone lactonase YvrE
MRAPIVMRILLLCCSALLLTASSVIADDLTDLPELGAVVTSRLPLGTDGVRGLIFDRGQAVILAGSNTGLSAPDSSYVVRLLRLEDAQAGPTTVAVEQDVFETGLVSDGQSWWSAGSLLGAQAGIYQIAPTSGEVLLMLPAPGYHPGGIAFDGTYLWIVDCDARKLLRVDVEEGRVSRKVESPGFYPTGLAYDGFHFWCADATTGRIYRLKGHNGRTDAVISPDAFYRPGEFVSLSWDGDALWAVAASDSEAVRLELLR